MSKQRHIQLENISRNLTAKLQRTAGAYRLGNLTKQEALAEAETALTKSFTEIMKYTKNVPVPRDLGKKAKPLSKIDVKELKSEIKIKLADFEKVLDDIK